MDRVATDVAKSPVSGGDLPSFEELLAKGSFHARLAQARAARERALAMADPADGFILNTSRKPWDRDDAVPKVDGRPVMSVMAKVAATPSNVARLRSDPAPEPASTATPAAEGNGAEAGALLTASVRRLHIVPQTARVEGPIGEPGHKGRRVAMIGGGFASGLAAGAVLAFGTLWLAAPDPGQLQGGPMVPDAARALALPEVVMSSDGAVFAAARFEAPPVRPAAAPLATPGGADPILVLAAASPSLAADGPVSPVARTDPAEVPFAAVEALPFRPAAPLHGPGLSPVAVPEPPPAASQLSAPALRPDFRAPQPGLAGAAAGGIEFASTLPQPETTPSAVRVALLASLPAAPDGSVPVQPVPVAPGPRFPGPVVMNAPESLTEAEIAAIVEELRGRGFVLTEPARVAATVKQSNVRYFHEADAEAAAAVAAALGAIVRDFTDFASTPPAGTIEVWIAGRGPTSAAVPGKTKRVTKRSAQTELEILRNRILRQLRSGEHL